MQFWVFAVFQWDQVREGNRKKPSKRIWQKGCYVLVSYETPMISWGRRWIIGTEKNMMCVWYPGAVQFIVPYSTNLWRAKTWMETVDLQLPGWKIYLNPLNHEGQCQYVPQVEAITHWRYRRKHGNRCFSPQQLNPREWDVLTIKYNLPKFQTGETLTFLFPFTVIYPASQL